MSLWVIQRLGSRLKEMRLGSAGGLGWTRLTSEVRMAAALQLHRSGPLLSSGSEHCSGAYTRGRRDGEEAGQGYHLSPRTFVESFLAAAGFQGADQEGRAQGRYHKEFSRICWLPGWAVRQG